MTITNNSAKIIGFGGVSVLPGQSSELPSAYSENHPTIKYFIGRKMIKVLSKPEGKADAKAKAAQENKAGKEPKVNASPTPEPAA